MKNGTQRDQHQKRRNVHGQRENFGLGVGVGGNANFSARVGGNANFSVFRYQHVAIPNTKLWRWESKPT